MSNAVLLALAMLLDALAGEPPWLWSRLPHPAVLMGSAVRWLDNRLNHGSDRARRLKGVLAAAILAGVSIALGIVLGLGGPVVEVLVAAVLLAQKSLVQHVAAVAAGLRRSLEDGRAAVAMIVSRETREMTQSDVARAAIESASENLSDGVIAPAFWFLVGGLPGLILYKSINTADSMIGYLNPRYAAFGWASARCDDLLNLVPARLTAVLIALVTGATGQWRAIVDDARRHRSPNAGWPEAAMARALGVALAGPRTYDGRRHDLHWVHPEGARTIGPREIDAAIARLWRAWALAWGVIVAVAIFQGGTLWFRALT